MVIPRSPRVVIDTTVWISGLLTKTGAPTQLIRQAIRQSQPVLTMATFEELKQQLWLPKFDRYVTMEARKQLLQDIDVIAFWVDVTQAISELAFSRDTTDDQFIQAALAAEAGCLVTGDKDLLVLSESLLSSGIRIISPAEALQLPEFSS